MSDTLTDKLWIDTYKKASVEGKLRNDVITVDCPIPEWALEKLREYENGLDVSKNTKDFHINSIRTAMRTLAERYGDLDPRKIDEEMIRSIGDILSNHKRSSLYPLRVGAGKLVALYTGVDPWVNRRRHLVRKSQISVENEKKFFDAMLNAGFSKTKAEQELVLIEHALNVLSQNLEDFNPSCFGIEEILQLGRFQLGMNKRQLNNYKYALGRYVWAITGTDPMRVSKCHQKKIPVNIQNRIIQTGFGDEFDEFIEWNLKRGVKINTIESYLYKILSLWETLDSVMPVGWRIEDIEMEDLVAVRVSATHLKESTLHEAMCSLSIMLRFLGNDSYDRAMMLWNDDTDHMKRTWIDMREWKSVLASADQNQLLILALGGGMGLRRMEIANLKVSDIEGDIMTIHGKGHGPNGKVVHKQIPPSVLNVINEYLPFREELLRKWGNECEDTLLVSSYRYVGKPLGMEGINSTIRKLSRETGIEMSTHTLRRFYATSLDKIGTDLDTIRRMMRHTKLDTTLSHYINANPERMAKAEKDLDAMLFC